MVQVFRGTDGNTVRSPRDISIPIIVGMAIIGFHHWNNGGYWYSEILMIDDWRTRFAVGYILQMVGWLLWSLGMVWGFQRVILSRNPDPDPNRDYVKFMTGGAVLIGVGFILLALIRYGDDWTLDWESNQMLYSIGFLSLGSGFIIVGQGLFFGLRKIIHTTRPETPDMEMNRARSVMIGASLFGTGYLIVGFLGILDSYDSAVYHGMSHLLRGIGMMVLLFGMASSFTTCFSRSEGMRLDRIGDRYYGKVSMILLTISGVLFLIAYFMLSIRYLTEFHQNLYRLEDALPYRYIAVSNTMISVAYFLLAGAFPLLLYAASSVPPIDTTANSSDPYAMRSGGSSGGVYTPPPGMPVWKSRNSHSRSDLPSDPASTPGHSNAEHSSTPYPNYAASGWVCSECGTNVEHTFKFCSNCGYPK